MNEQQPTTYGNAYDVSDKAEFYTWAHYGHHKHVVYPLFIDIIGALSRHERVLDIGAGPGHLELEFAKARPADPCRFTLLDSSVRLLELARQRLAQMGERAQFIERDYNGTGWATGLDRFDAIVSNNSLFHVKEDRLGEFYSECHGLLRTDGILLNQQSFSYQGRSNPYASDPFTDFMSALPKRILPADPQLSAQYIAELASRKSDAGSRHMAAIEEAKRSTQAPGLWMEYHFLGVEQHLSLMRAAGFTAGCIWRQREFAVVLGVKGRPTVVPE